MLPPSSSKKAKYQAKHKTPVVVLVERHGLARVKVIASVTQKNLGAALGECVSQEAAVNIDEHPATKAR